jgi:hypothetical protein
MARAEAQRMQRRNFSFFFQAFLCALCASARVRFDLKYGKILNREIRGIHGQKTGRQTTEFGRIFLPVFSNFFNVLLPAQDRIDHSVENVKYVFLTVLRKNDEQAFIKLLFRLDFREGPAMLPS